MTRFLRFSPDRLGARHRVFLVLILTNTVVWLDMLQFSVLSPFWSRDLSLSPAQLSGAPAAYLLGYFPLIFVAGVLTDRLGSRRMLLICLAGVTVLSTSTMLVSTYPELWLRNLVYGAFLGFLWSPVNKLMASWLSPRELPTFASIWAGSVAFNGVIALLLALPIANHLNWRLPFLVVAAVAAPAFILMWRVVTDHPEDKKGITDREVAHICFGRQSGKTVTAPSWGEIFRLYKQRNIILMTLATAIATAPTWMLGPWSSYGLIVLHKVDPDVVATTLPWMSLAVLGYGFINGAVLIRVFGGRTRPALALAPVLITVAYLAAAYMHLPWLIWAMCTSLLPGVAGLMFWGTINPYWMGLSGPRFAGTLNGLGGAAQVAVGFLLTNQGGLWVDKAAAGPGQLSPLLLIGAVICLVSVVPVFLSPEVDLLRRPALATESLE